MNIPRIDGVDPERLLEIIQAIQKQRDSAIEKSDAPVAEYATRPPAPAATFAPAAPAAGDTLPAVGRFVNIWA